MATKEERGAAPQAVIHKRILEVAEAAPEASLEALAEEIAGATPALVERVLDEYGDPAGGSLIEDEPAEEQAMSEATIDTPTDLTEKQRVALRAIAQRPEATQSELAEYLGVSRATVNKRLNDIPGFEWGDRQTFVASVLDEADHDGQQGSATTTGEAAVDGGQLRSPDVIDDVNALEDRVSRLEQQFDQSVTGTASRIEETELLAKVMRAVLADDTITESEEVRVFESLL